VTDGPETDQPIVDTHVHLALDELMTMAGRPHGTADYGADAGAVGVGTACVLAMAPSDDHDRTVFQNNLVLNAEIDGIRTVPFCSVHPADGSWALQEIDRISGAGARGLKLHPNTQQFDVADPAVVEVVKHAGELGLVVLFDAFSLRDPAQIGKFVDLAIVCPDTDIILAHLGGPKFPEMMAFAVLAEYPWWQSRVWFDISWTVPTYASSPFAEQLLWVCRKLGADRLYLEATTRSCRSRPR
jgi:hypothetical protein